MFDELKNNWKNQKATLPNIDELKSSIGKERNSIRNKYFLAIALLLLAIIVGATIWIVIPFTSLSTKIAFILMGAAILGGIGYMLYLQQLLPKMLDNTKSSQEFTQDWMEYRKKSQQHTNTFMIVYMVILTIGLALYLYEVTASNMLFRGLAYGSTAAWLLYVIFVLAPKQKRKSEKSINKVLESYQKIADQF